MLKTLVAYRLIDPGSEWRLHRQWYERSAMGDLLGEEFIAQPRLERYSLGSSVGQQPLEERRTQAVYARRAGEPSGAGDLGALDAAAIERVRDEARPDPHDPDELHDALLSAEHE